MHKPDIPRPLPRCFVCDSVDPVAIVDRMLLCCDCVGDIPESPTLTRQRRALVEAQQAD